MTLLWTDPDGARCIITPYDETRYQLRLVRKHGTVKADLFPDYAQAVAMSGKWREQFRNTS